MEQFLNIMRGQHARQAGLIANTRIGRVTSYDPAKYACKVLILPEGDFPDVGDTGESGWIPVQTSWSGSSWGMFCPPSVGDQVLVVHAEGDAGSGQIVGRVFDATHAPLSVPSGEFWLVHAKGSQIKITNDGNITINANQNLIANVAGTTNIATNGTTSISSTGTTSVSSSTGSTSVSGTTGVSLSSPACASVSGSASVSVSSPATTTVSGGSSVAVSSQVAATMSGGATCTTSGGLNTTAGSFVMQGTGAAGNLSSLPGSAGSLFASFKSSGLSAIFSNPIASNLSSLTASITSAVSGITSLPGLLSADISSLTSALTGTAGLSAAALALGAHTDSLSGLTSIAGNVPSLSGVIGVANGLDIVAGGAYGSSSNVLSGMTSGLAAGPTVDAITSSVSNIVPTLTIGGSSAVAGVLSSLTAHSTALTGIVSSDTSNYLAAQANVTQASNFLSAVGMSKSINTAAQTLVAQVIPSDTLSTLQGIQTLGG